ncbi:hypothetical protein Tco_1300577 [Tanacetum coccineum]
MYCDNAGAIAIANESGITKGARHFRAKVHYLREVIKYGDIKLEKVHTYDNLADPFTKALAFPKHSKHTKNIGMLPASGLIENEGQIVDIPIASISANEVASHVVSKNDGDDQHVVQSNNTNMGDEAGRGNTKSGTFNSSNNSASTSKHTEYISYANKLNTISNNSKANFHTLESQVPDKADFDVAIPKASVEEISNRLKNSLYGYFISKKVAFHVVEMYIWNTWGKY